MTLWIMLIVLAPVRRTHHLQCGARENGLCGNHHCPPLQWCL